MNNYVVNFSSV